MTGAGGYIGSIATYMLLEKGHTVVAVDNFSTGYTQPLDLLKKQYGDGLRIYKADLQHNIESVFKQESQIDAVIHYAANCSVNESMLDPQKYFTNNTMGSQNLLVSMLKHDVSQIIFSSTCAVYGEAQHVPIDENHPTNPTNPYGASKRLTEEIISWYGQLKDLHYVVLRYFNVCGASDDGLLGDAKKPSVHLMQNVVRGALGIEPFHLTCPEVDTPDKTPIRDYVNVVDLNNAHLLALDYLQKGGKNEIINLGTGVGNSVLEIVKAVEEKTGVSIPLKKAAARKGEYARMIASHKKAEELLGWKPTHSLSQSIDSLVTWYGHNPHGWSK